MVRRQLVVPAAPDEVWAALTDPAEVAAWFGASVAWTLAPGGAARFEEADGTVRLGRIDEVVPGRRLRFRWSREDGTEASEVTYDVDADPDGEGARLVVTERPLVPARASATAAWSVWDGRLLALWACLAAPVAAACR